MWDVYDTSHGRIIPQLPRIGGPCWCGGKFLLRTSKRGQFLGCSKFPKCRVTYDIKKLVASKPKSPLPPMRQA